MNPFQDHEALYEDLYGESVDKKAKPGKKEDKKLPADIILPVFPSKEKKPVVKTAKAGGYVRAADGCAKRGKTRGKMV